jgi:hypothetical protein
MGFVENVRVSEKRAQAGIGAEQDRPSAIFGTREIGRDSISEYPSAETDEAIRIRF